MTATGIDGYPGGWVAVTAHDGGLTWATAPVAAIGDLVLPSTTTGIDMPIGLLDTGERSCDALARGELPGAASRVFITPPRPVLVLGPQSPNSEVQVVARATMGKGVSRQALGLGPRILALDALLSARPGLDVVEVHPELSFAELTGHVLGSKKSAAGVGQRLAALAAWLPTTAEVLGRAPADVPVDDALDALAALWSAQRWRAGRARTLPASATAPPFIAI